MSSSPPDKSLTERLDKLKGQGQTIDQKELEERIARFKGIDPAKFTLPPITVYRPPDTRTDVQKADSLLESLMNEVAIDSSVDRPGEKSTSASIEEIEKRLQSLKGVGSDNTSKSKSVLPDDSDLEMDSDTECELIAKKLLEEAKLPDVSSVLPARGNCKADTSDEKDPDSQPWCVICSEDAILTCKDCDEDLYCMECFQEFHGDRDMRGHRTKSLAK